MKKIIRLIKIITIENFQYRFLGKTGYGNNLLRLRKFRVYHRQLFRSAKDPLIYFTLDVEWGNTPYFSQMLDVLKAKQVCAYLFLQGEGMEENRDLLQRILADGHGIGNHTMTHPNLTQCSPSKVLEELNSCRDTFYRLTGTSMPNVLRPPFGRIHRPLAKFLYKEGYTVMHWSLHVPDFQEEQPSWGVYEAYLKERLHNGGILLQHSFSSATAENLDKIIDFCRSQGYRFAEKKDYDRFLSRK